MTDLPPEMIPRDLSEAKVAIAELRIMMQNQQAKIEEGEAERTVIRTELTSTTSKLATATSEFEKFKAQLSGGWKVLVFLGGITMAISYLAYNLKNIFGVK